jgi:hypothetical protein
MHQLDRFRLNLVVAALARDRRGERYRGEAGEQKARKGLH